MLYLDKLVKLEIIQSEVTTENKQMCLLSHIWLLAVNILMNMFKLESLFKLENYWKNMRSRRSSEEVSTSGGVDKKVGEWNEKSWMGGQDRWRSMTRVTHVFLRKWILPGPINLVKTNVR